MKTIDETLPIEKLEQSLVPIEDEVQAYSGGMTLLTLDTIENLVQQPHITPRKILIGSVRDGAASCGGADSGKSVTRGYGFRSGGGRPERIWVRRQFV